MDFGESGRKRRATPRQASRPSDVGHTERLLGTASQLQLFESARGLAFRLAQRFTGRGEPADDLQQVALLGLAKAASRFDPDRGVLFSTFATRVVTGELKRHFRDSAWTVKPPRVLHDLYHRAKAANEALTEHLGRHPTVDEIAAYLDETTERILEATSVISGYRALSLDAPINGNERRTIDITQTDVAVEVVDQRSELTTLLSKLDDEQRVLIQLYFFEERSQQEIGDELGMSQVSVSRRLTRTIERLRAFAAA